MKVNLARTNLICLTVFIQTLSCLSRIAYGAPCYFKRWFQEPTIDDEDDTVSLHHTLSSQVQTTYRGADTLTWQYTDNLSTTDPSIIIEPESNCDASDIFISLQISKVIWSDDRFVTDTEIPSEEYEDYKRMGGAKRTDPQRGKYSPAYLNLPAVSDNPNSLEAQLVIDSSNPDYLPDDLAYPRAYRFYYNIAFTQDQDTLNEERRKLYFVVEVQSEIMYFQPCYMPMEPILVPMAGSQSYDLLCGEYFDSSAANAGCEDRDEYSVTINRV